MKNVKVKLTGEHQHDGRSYKKDDVLELPEDLAAFVIEHKKGVAVQAASAEAAARKN